MSPEAVQMISKTAGNSREVKLVPIASGEFGIDIDPYFFFPKSLGRKLGPLEIARNSSEARHANVNWKEIAAGVTKEAKTSGFGIPIREEKLKHVQ